MAARHYPDCLALQRKWCLQRKQSQKVLGRRVGHPIRPLFACRISGSAHMGSGIATARATPIHTILDMNKNVGVKGNRSDREVTKPSISTTMAGNETDSKTRAETETETETETEVEQEIEIEIEIETET
eukprot:COSAG02_NODE_131_length_34710_cov_17.171159_31_plen_129_part_00